MEISELRRIEKYLVEAAARCQIVFPSGGGHGFLTSWLRIRFAELEARESVRKP